MEKEKDTLLQNKGKLQPDGASQLNVTLSKYDNWEDEKKLKHRMRNTPWVPQAFLSNFLPARNEEQVKHVPPRALCQGSESSVMS